MKTQNFYLCETIFLSKNSIFIKRREYNILDMKMLNSKIGK